MYEIIYIHILAHQIKKQFKEQDTVILSALKRQMRLMDIHFILLARAE